MYNGVLEIFQYFLVYLVMSVFVGLFLHVRNTIHHHDSPLTILVLGCLFVSLMPVGFVYAVAALTPPSISSLLLSPVSATASVLLATGVLNYLVYGFHWKPEIDA